MTWSYRIGPRGGWYYHVAQDLQGKVLAVESLKGRGYKQEEIEVKVVDEKGNETEVRL